MSRLFGSFIVRLLGSEQLVYLIDRFRRAGHVLHPHLSHIRLIPFGEDHDISEIEDRSDDLRVLARNRFYLVGIDVDDIARESFLIVEYHLSWRKDRKVHLHIQHLLLEFRREYDLRAEQYDIQSSQHSCL